MKLTRSFIIAPLSVVASIITIIMFFGYPTFFSIMGNDDEFKPQIEANCSIIKFTPTDIYDRNYKTNLNMGVDVWTPHLSKLTLKLIGFNLSNESNDYLAYSIKNRLPIDSWTTTIHMNDLTYPIDTKHDSRLLSIPIDIQHLWIDVFYTSHTTSFELGTITVMVELEDVERGNSIEQAYIIPIYYEYKDH